MERVAVIANGTLIEVANMEELKKTHQNNLENYLIGKMSGGKYHD